MVLDDLHAWMNLGEYLAERGSAEVLRRRAERVGRALATLHRSSIAFGRAEPEPLGKRFRATCARIDSRLQGAHPDTDLPRRFGELVRRVEARAISVPRRPPAPIHGRFGLDCVLYDVEGSFHLYRFEACRHAQPGLDLGGFLADLRSLARSGEEEEIYAVGRESLLSGYHSKEPRRFEPGELGFYETLAAIERLDPRRPRLPTPFTRCSPTARAARYSRARHGPPSDPSGSRRLPSHCGGRSRPSDVEWSYEGKDRTGALGRSRPVSSRSAPRGREQSPVDLSDELAGRACRTSSSTTTRS